jgi:hypothetical protein
MKQYSYLIVGFIIFFHSCKYPNNCTDLRTGNFGYYSSNLNSEVLVTRTDSTQIETVVSSGKSAISKIEWKNDCEYRLIFLNVNFPISDSDLTYLRNHFTNSKIIAVENDYYITEWTETGSSQLNIDTIRIIKK